MARINESSLSRILSHMKTNDTGIISAFRYARDCGIGEIYSLIDNKKRNRLLQVKLHSLGYSITSIKGTYIENYKTKNEIEVKENAFFVSDVNNRGTLLNDLKTLGEEFEQDSILFIPMGGEYSELVGVSDCKDSYPGKNIVKKIGIRQMGEKGEFFSKIVNRPFRFHEIIKEHASPHGMLSRMACNSISKQSWQEIELND